MSCQRFETSGVQVIRYPHDKSQDSAAVELSVRDAWPLQRAGDISLHTAGFQVFDSVTALSTEDFMVESEVSGRYYREMEREMARLTGADEVICWNHFIRWEALPHCTC